MRVTATARTSRVQRLLARPCSSSSDPRSPSRPLDLCLDGSWAGRGMGAGAGVGEVSIYFAVWGEAEPL